MQLLLLSNSTLKGQPYLGWPQQYLHSFLTEVKSVIFVPYAGVTIGFNEYTQMFSHALSDFNLNIKGVHTIENKTEQILEADCVVVGGGNTFSLLKNLQDSNLIEPLQRAVANGVKYIGWSAGANMACPTIRTTNDMPIEQPQSFSALGLIDYQINPHFTNAVLPNHGGETRETRLKEYLVKNQNAKVIGLPEGMLIEVDGENSYLKGEGQAYLFSYGKDSVEIKPGELKL